MLFCKSLILRKKSFDISEAGLMVRAGAKGGPVSEYDGDMEAGFGGGGCRAMYAGTMTRKSIPKAGIRARR